MSQLRWALLVLGVLFVAALAWWELRRPRHAARTPAERLTPTIDATTETIATAPQPTLDLSQLRAREAPPPIPVIEVPLGVEARETSAAPDAAPASPEEPTQASPPTILPPEEPSAAAGPEPIVDWPAEDVRRIVALRLVANAGERFAGRSVRQALAAEGFVFGRFSIFHKVGPDARAILSAASLSKPGTFAPESMDGQRFGGLNLFAILPGPLPAPQAFDELLTAARGLNERLQGALQDEHGEPLTPTRTANIRDTLAASGQAAAGSAS